MKISPVSKSFMAIAGAALLAAAPMKAQTTSTQGRQNRQEVDTFTFTKQVSPYGTMDKEVLANAPSANVKIEVHPFCTHVQIYSVFKPV